MHGTIRPIGAWLSTFALVAAVFAALTVRGSADPCEPAADPSADPAQTAAAPIGRVVLGNESANAPLAPPQRSAPPPTPEPAPLPTPVPPSPPPAPAAPPPSDGAGGGLAPRTAPPGWTPPATIPGDVWTTGAFGQTLTAGGIAVTASRLPLDADPATCALANELPDGYAWVGFLVTTTWSGFPIPVYGADAPQQGLATCWIGDPPPMTSGVTYQVFKQVPEGLAATTSIHFGYFPNGASPAYIFDFH